MLLARATGSALRIAHRPAGNALCSSRRFGPASSLFLSSPDLNARSRPLSSSVTPSNDSVAPPTSTPPPPAFARSEESIIADRSTADSPPSTLSTEQEPSTTPSASPSSPTASHFALRHTSTPAGAPAGAPIDPSKPRDEVQAPPSRRVFVRGAVVQKDEEGLLQEVAKVLDLERTQLTLWRRSTDEGETKRKGYGWIELPTVSDAEKLIKLAPLIGERRVVYAFAASPRAHDPTALTSAPLPPRESPTSQHSARPTPSPPPPLNKEKTTLSPATDISRSVTSSNGASSSSPSQRRIRSGVVFRQLASETTKDQLKAAVMGGLDVEEGDIVNCRVPRKGEGNKGFGFVELSSPELAHRLSRLPRSALNLGSDFHTELYHPTSRPKASSVGTTPTNSLYIRDLPPRTRPASIYQSLEPYGTVWRCKRVPSRDPKTGAELLAVFVGMETVAAAQAVLEQARSVDGLLVRGAPVRVTFASVLRGKGLRTEKDDEEMARRRRQLLEARKAGLGLGWVRVGLG